VRLHDAPRQLHKSLAGSAHNKCDNAFEPEEGQARRNKLTIMEHGGWRELAAMAYAAGSASTPPCVIGVCAFHEDPPCIKRRVSRRWAGGRLTAARGRANVPEG
jgi:hypothetical protein